MLLASQVSFFGQGPPMAVTLQEPTTTARPINAIALGSQARRPSPANLRPGRFSPSLGDCPGAPNNRWPWASAALPACGQACARSRPGGAGSASGVPAGMASPRLDRLNCSGSMALPFAVLRPYIEFIPDAWHREYESWRLRVRLYLAPQASDEHIDAAIIGFRGTPGNGVTELVTR